MPQIGQLMHNPWKPLPGKSDNRHIFAIGDVHGQDKALRKALKRIRETPSEPGVERVLVFTGDLIDRGPGNMACIEMMMNARELAGVNVSIFLPGNHELMMIEGLLYEPDMFDLWVANGGMAVLDEILPNARMSGKVQAVTAGREKLGPFMDFIAQCPNHLRIGDLLFVHAGLNPHYDQHEFLARPRFGIGKMSEHWAWVRNECLTWKSGWDPERRMVIVHGHTPHHQGNNRIADWDAHNYFDRVDEYRRICVDAGACSTPQIAVAEFYRGSFRISVVHEPEFLPV